ncbi:MAG: hypothetical protein JWO05_465 [Gemmatimonadetes bacterium]|nr:hypothetical protein [Gemmatimonadota bacterium]
MGGRRGLLAGLAVAAILLLAGRAVAQLYADYLWYDAMGAGDVWRARIIAVSTLRLGSGLVATAFVLANLYAVRRSIVSLVLPRRMANLDFGEEIPGHYLTGVAIALSVVLGALLTLPQDDWTSLVLAQRGVSFGETDPYFTADLGFFTYWLPFETSVFYWTLISVLFVVALVTFLYALTPSLRWEGGSMHVTVWVRRHLTVLGGVLLLLLSWHYRLEMFEVLSYGGGEGGAFTYVDHRVSVPGSLVLSISTLVAALIVMFAGWTGQRRMASFAVVGVVALSLSIRQVAPLIVRSASGDPDPVLRERPYEATRAGYTRRAFDVDRIRIERDPGFQTLGEASAGVPVWEAPALATATGRATDVRIGWSAAPEGIVATAVTPGDGTRSALAQRYLASAASERGAPVPLAAAGAREVDEHALLPARFAPDREGYDVVADSSGTLVGIPLAPLVTRLAFALSVQNLRLLFEDQPHPRPTLLHHRGVRERVDAIAPFLAQGSVVSPVVVGDSLFWMMDLYASSASYPLSRHAMIAGDERSYFHHAATAIVHAATGRTLIVADSTLDPIASTWAQVFPALFRSRASVSPALLQALPPAVDGARAQAIAFGRFGSRTDSDVPRHLPVGDGADSLFGGVETPMALARPGALAVVLPLLDEGERLRGALIATGGVDRSTSWLPLPGSERWTALVDRLRAMDTSIVRDPARVRGAVRLLPLAGSVAAIQSHYAWRGPVASLSRVHLAVGDSMRSGATLAAVAGAPVTGGASALTSADLRGTADSLYRVMRESMQRGDWTAFGRAFDALGRVLGGGR